MKRRHEVVINDEVVEPLRMLRHVLRILPAAIHSSEKPILVVPPESILQRPVRPFHRNADLSSLKGVVVTSVLILFLDSTAYLEVVVRGHRDVTAIKQMMDIRAESNPIRYLVLLDVRELADMSGLQGWKRAFSRNRAAAPIGVEYGQPEAVLSKT